MNTLDNLYKLLEPVISYMHNNYNPHTSLIINYDNVRVVEDKIALPINTDKEE